MEIIHKNNFGKAEYDKATKTLRTSYVGVANPNHIIDVLSKVIVYSEKENIKHMIANLTQMKGTFTGAMNFFEQEFYPKMIKNGLRTYAMAFSNDVFTKFAADQLQRKVENRLLWHAFPSVEDAEKWTDSQRDKN